MDPALKSVVGLLLLLLSFHAFGLTCRRVPAEEVVEKHDNIYVIRFQNAKLVSPELEKVRGEYTILRVLRSRGVGPLPSVEYALRGKDFWLRDIPVGEEYFLFWSEDQEIVEWQPCSGMDRYRFCREYEIVDVLGSSQDTDFFCEARMVIRSGISMYSEVEWFLRRLFHDPQLVDEVTGSGT